MNTVIHKCPNCNASLVPTTIVHIGTEWKNTKISAEIVMHLNKDNYYCWKCPECAVAIFSEVEFLYSFTHTGLERALRREKGEHCEAQMS